MRSGAVRLDRWEIVWLAAFVTVAVAKILLIADLDIIAAQRPHDDFWHIRAADAWVWRRPYSSDTLAHLPIFALTIALNSITGVPMRLAAEAVLIGGAVSLALSLGRLGVPRWVQCLVFVLILFHPHATALFSFSLAENWAGVLSLFLAGELIRLIVDPKSRLHAFGFGICFALLWYTRRESAPLLAGLLVSIALVLSWVGFRRSAKQAIAYAGSMLLAPIMATVVLTAALCTVNGLRYGVWITSDFSAPNFLRAYQGLQSIAVEHPRRFIPVSQEARANAYSVSPAFSELRPHLDGPVENWGATAGRLMGLSGDIGAGWFHWSLRAAVEAAGYYRDAQATEAFYGRVADDIERAFRSGQLLKRAAPIPFVDPAVALWLPHLPASILKVAAVLYPTGSINDLFGAPASLATAAVYDRVAHRRTPAGVVISGWVMPLSGPLWSIDALDVKSGAPLSSSSERIARPDLTPARAQDGSEVKGIGFSLRVQDSPVDNIRLRFVAGAVQAVTEPLSATPLRVPISLGAAPDVVLAIDNVWAPRRETRAKVRQFIAEWYPRSWLVAAGYVAAWFVVSIARRRRLTGYQVAAIAMLAAIVSSRAVFFAVIDASAWPGDQVRYLLPASLLFVVAPFLLCGTGAANHHGQARAPAAGSLRQRSANEIAA